MERRQIFVFQPNYAHQVSGFRLGPWWTNQTYSS